MEEVFTVRLSRKVYGVGNHHFSLISLKPACCNTFRVSALSFWLKNGPNSKDDLESVRLSSNGSDGLSGSTTTTYADGRSNVVLRSTECLPDWTTISFLSIVITCLS